MATKLNFLQYTYRFRINHKTLYSHTFPGPHFGSWTIWAIDCILHDKVVFLQCKTAVAYFMTKSVNIYIIVLWMISMKRKPFVLPNNPYRIRLWDFLLPKVLLSSICGKSGWFILRPNLSNSNRYTTKCILVVTCFFHILWLCNHKCISDR